jgi:hypothetical protein
LSVQLQDTIVMDWLLPLSKFGVDYGSLAIDHLDTSLRSSD